MLYAVTKRLIDLAGALIGLAITCLFYLPIAIALKLDSPGPVIFAQPRLGKGERLFRVYKFRTMLCTPDPAALTKPGPGDERITHLGRFLRHTSLDELPQFYNVLHGEMSLVGPRPEQIPFAAYYEGSGRRRFLVKPGLTGWWQVHGRPQPMYDHVEYDLYYVEHRCLWLDLQILLRTVAAVAGGEGAV